MAIAVGCSNWKRMFAVLNGVLPPTESTERPAEETLRKVNRLVNLKPEEREWRLKKYFKFIMLRNPLERLVSAYRNKVSILLSTKFCGTFFSILQITWSVKLRIILVYSGWSRWKGGVNANVVYCWLDCLFQVCIPVDFVHKGTFPSREALFMLVKFENNRYKRWMHDGHRDEIWPNFDSFLRFSTLFPRLWVYTLCTWSCCIYGKLLQCSKHRQNKESRTVLYTSPTSQSDLGLMYTSVRTDRCTHLSVTWILPS